MRAIQDLSPEVIDHIFRLGCEDNPASGWYEHEKEPRSQRVRHPFISAVTPVCRSWYSITKWKPNHHHFFMCLDLTVDYGSTEKRFLESFGTYRHCLEQSKGSNLFITWTYHSEKGSIDPAGESTARIYMHGMHITLKYQSQLQSITAGLFSTEVLAYFILLPGQLRSVHSIEWNLGFNGLDWPTFSSSTTSPFYLDADYDGLSDVIQNQNEADLSSTIWVKGVLVDDRPIKEAATSVEINHLSIKFGTLKTILFDCHHVSHLTMWNAATAIPRTKSPNETLFRFSSLKSIHFSHLHVSSVLYILANIEFPKLWLISLTSLKMDGGGEPGSGNTQLPFSVSEVRSIILGAESKWVLLFDGLPDSPLEGVQRSGNKFDFGCDMLSSGTHPETSHKWRLTLEGFDINTFAIKSFLEGFKIRYWATLSNSPGGEWMKKVVQLEEKVAMVSTNQKPRPFFSNGRMEYG